MRCPLGSSRIGPGSSNALSALTDVVYIRVSAIIVGDAVDNFIEACNFVFDGLRALCNSEAICGELSTVVPTVAIETLPRVTGCYVEVRLDSLNFLLVVHVEVEKSVALELLNVLISTSTVVVVAVPSCRRVCSEIDVLLRLAHVVTEVEVEVEVGEPFQSVVDLEVTVAAEHSSLVVAVACNGDWVVHTVHVESSTVHLRVVSVPQGVALKRTVAHDVVVVDRSRRVHSHSTAHSTIVRELVLYPVALSVGINFEATLKELRSKSETNGCTVHLRVDKDTIVVGVSDSNTIRKESYGTTYAEVVVVRESSAEHFVLPVGA